jgi:hypothetical protein
MRREHQDPFQKYKINSKLMLLGAQDVKENNADLEAFFALSTYEVMDVGSDTCKVVNPLRFSFQNLMK